MIIFPPLYHHHTFSYTEAGTETGSILKQYTITHILQIMLRHESCTIIRNKIFMGQNYMKLCSYAGLIPDISATPRCSALWIALVHLGKLDPFDSNEVEKTEASSVHEEMNTKRAREGDGPEEWGVNKIMQIPQ
jgi:hypothetical protein